MALKGHSTAVGLDFNTCLGQLLKRMGDGETAHFGLVVPKTPQYERQIGSISRRVRQALDLHWILVSEGGSVEVLRPGDDLAWSPASASNEADGNRP